MQAGLEGGFADPVINAQGCFRAVLDALANPGKIQTLVLPPTPGLSLAPELAAIMLTLCDHDTPVWLDATLRADPAVGTFLAFHTGAPIVDAPEAAAFAFAAGAAHLPLLSQFNLGTQEYPDRSTTLVLVVPALEGGTQISARGPGIKDTRLIAPTGLPQDFRTQWADNRALFPRGIDLLLVAGGAVLGLPRTTRLEGDA